MAADFGLPPERETPHSRIGFPDPQLVQDVGKLAGASVPVRADKKGTVVLRQPIAPGANSTEVRRPAARGLASGTIVVKTVW